MQEQRHKNLSPHMASYKNATTSGLYVATMAVRIDLNNPCTGCKHMDHPSSSPTTIIGGYTATYAERKVRRSTQHKCVQTRQNSAAGSVEISSRQGGQQKYIAHNREERGRDIKGIQWREELDESHGRAA